jgi:N-methylhydantoinase A
LVPRHLRFDVPERMAADGSVLKKLDEAYVRKLVGELRDKGVKAIGVCYLNSFRNPEHEKRTAEIIAEVAPKIRVSLSSEVVSRFASFNAQHDAGECLCPETCRITWPNCKRAWTRRISRQLFVMCRAAVSPRETVTIPVRLLESGPRRAPLARR